MKLSLLKKYGDLNEKKTISAIRTTMRAADSGTRLTTRLTRTRHAVSPSDGGGAAGSVGSGTPAGLSSLTVTQRPRVRSRFVVISSPASSATTRPRDHHERAVGHLDDLLVVGGRDQNPDPL